MSGPVGACLARPEPESARDLATLRRSRTIPMRPGNPAAPGQSFVGDPVVPMGLLRSWHHPDEFVGRIPLHSRGASAKNDLGTRI